MLPNKLDKGICQNKYRITININKKMDIRRIIFLYLVVKIISNVIEKIIDFINSSPFLKVKPDSKPQNTPTEIMEINNFRNIPLFFFMYFKSHNQNA